MRGLVSRFLRALVDEELQRRRAGALLRVPAPSRGIGAGFGYVGREGKLLHAHSDVPFPKTFTCDAKPCKLLQAGTHVGLWGVARGESVDRLSPNSPHAGGRTSGVGRVADSSIAVSTGLRRTGKGHRRSIRMQARESLSNHSQK